ncbi:unnamed protein product [Adineta steineri]|uniref:Uncharacterized protein n=1 Tax=Adineta steineri TaxID=433720 RepID=A0A813W265_9BILA|nr:unnamed protein product [Adineta steineri]CAF3939803.1 unnamed protein product [Adineta steineri]
MTNNGTSMIPPLPLNCSIYPFNSYSSSHHTKPSLSFPAQSSNRINEEYLTKMHQIIESSSSTNSNETEPIELPIHHSQSIPIHRLDCALPAMSRDDSEDNNIDLSSSLVFVNSSLHLQRKSDILPTTRDQNRSIKSHLNEPSKQEYHSNQKLINSHAQNPRFNQRGSTNFTRLPHSLRDKNGSFNSPSSPGTFQPSAANNPFGRRSYPQFESVRTPMQNSSTRKQESQSKIPSEVFNCCQTETVRSSTDISSTQRNVNRRYSTTTENQLNESEMRSNYFRDVTKIRDIMLNASKRLTNENDLPIPIVDTHCHFDLIFDRLRIKHNNLNQYFNDYKEYYPPGLSFELAIQVFWRPKHLTEDNWVKWYSKYLDDERVYGSCGIHPHWSSSWNDTSNDDIERCLQHPKIVAIGEIGLDYGPKNSCLPYQQRQAFEAQLKLAAKWLKPIVIHSRDAYQETFSLMKQYLESDHKIHLHCFVGTMDDVYLFTSYFTEIKFGFTPIITRFNFLHTVIQQLELTQILSETDSPYFIPDELYAVSKCAHPGMVYSVVEMVAKVRQLPISYVATQLRENARHIYGI